MKNLHSEIWEMNIGWRVISGEYQQKGIKMDYSEAFARVEKVEDYLVDILSMTKALVHYFAF